MTPSLLASVREAALAAPTMVAWMVTTLIVTLLLTLVAAVVQRLSRGSVPHRLVWGVALFTAGLFTATQPWRRVAPTTSLPASVVAIPDSIAPTAAPPSAWTVTLASVSTVARSASDAVVSTAMRSAAGVRTLPIAAQLFLVLLWPTVSVALVGVGVWSFRRQRTVVRNAAPVEAHGHTLFVSPSTGPAVFGVMRPRIVVPAWFLQRAPDEQRLVVAHEQAHIAAADPALLLAACFVTALTPWNPCAWFMLSRLRLAIELDCDTRVLQAGAAPRHYGALLIDLSATATPAPRLTGAAAFSHHASHLERRLRFMTDRPITHRTSRRLASLSLGALAIIAACGAELPTSAELQGMDVAAAEKRAFVAAPNMTAARYVVDGKETSERDAKSIAANRIASIEIRKRDKTSSEVRITTQAATSGGGSEQTVRVVEGGPLDGPVAAKAPFDGLLIVDGVKTDPAKMNSIDPKTILNVEVIKGAAAEKAYGPEGAKGVIRITTKK